MMLNRILLVICLFAASESGAWASTRPRPIHMAEEEAHNEIATPSFVEQVREAHRIASFLADALLLNNAQLRAVENYTLAEREALALAANAADLLQAQQAYLQAVNSVLAASQLHAYVALRQKLAGTAFPLDGTELALR